ncbi:MAG: hypothetical protein ACK4WD_13970, partial [Flavobacteriales bacterium]
HPVRLDFALMILKVQTVFHLLYSITSCYAGAIQDTHGLQLPEGGDFGDENCLPALNLIRSTKLHLSTEPPISCRCCYRLVLYFHTL